MSPTLISSIISGAANLFPAIGGLFAHGFKGFRSAWQSMGDATTGAHLTGAQREANAFTAGQAQRQMDFQQQMRDSQYQSAVADMKSAGLNPAVMYGSGASGNSAPSGAMASSVAPTAPDVTGLLGQMANLSLLRAQQRNIDADTQNKLADSDLKKVNREKVENEINLVRNQIDGSSLDNTAKRITNSFLAEQLSAGIRVQNATADQLDADKKRLNEFVNNLKVDQLKSYVSMLTDLEKIQNLRKERELSDAQIKELAALARQANETANNLHLQNENFDYINGVTINANVGVGPFRGSSSRFQSLSEIKRQAQNRIDEMESYKNHEKVPYDNGLGMDYHDYRID